MPNVRQPALTVVRCYALLCWHDPATGRHILTYDDQRDRADQERAARVQERTRAEAAAARAEQLEAELRRLREG